MPLSAPAGTAEQGIASPASDFTFPAGTYDVTLEEVRPRDIPTGPDGTPFAGWTSDEGVVLGLQFGQIEALEIEGQENVEIGDRKFFVDLTLNDGELTLDDVDLNARNIGHWQLQRSARVALSLAAASGHMEEVDGQEIVPDTFFEMLSEGNLNGLNVGLTIGNRKESSKKFTARVKQAEKDGEPMPERRVYDFAVNFFPLPS